MSTDSPFAASPAMQPAPPAKDNTLKIILIVLGVLFLLVVLCVGILALMLFPAITTARSAAVRMQTSNHMKLIGLAMHNYHDTHNQLPPAFITDAEGEPASSWRVSILPYIEERQLFERWASGESWQSDNNKPLLSETPSVYRLTSDSQVGVHDGECHVFIIDDPSAVFSGDERRRLSDIRDGTSNTIMALYLPNRSVPWSAPQDISIDEAYQEVSRTLPEAPVQLLMCDASVQAVVTPPDRETFEAMVTRAGNEVIDDFSFAD